MPLSLTEFVAGALAYEAAIRVWSGKARLWGSSGGGLGPGGVRVCVCVFVNVRGTSPVSLRPEDATAIYTVCVIHLAGGWGGEGVRIICTRAGKGPQVSVSCENLLAVKSTYTLWNPLTCLHCFITRSAVRGALSLNDTVELPSENCHLQGKLISPLAFC